MTDETNLARPTTSGPTPSTAKDQQPGQDATPSVPPQEIQEPPAAKVVQPTSEQVERPQTTDPPPQTPFGPIPVGKVQTQTFRRKDGSTVQRTVRVINPHTDSKYAK